MWQTFAYGRKISIVSRVAHSLKVGASLHYLYCNGIKRVISMTDTSKMAIEWHSFEREEQLMVLECREAISTLPLNSSFDV